MMPSAAQLPYLGPLLDHTEDAIMAWDADWRVTVWNEGARRMYGWTAEEAIGRPETFFRLGESDAQCMDRRSQLAEYGRWRGEVTSERKDGSKVPVEAISVAIRDEQDGISGYLGIHRDITERKRAEEALRAANRQTEAILERISDTFFAVDGEWRYTYVNDRAVAQAGKAWGRKVSAEELLGGNCWELFPQAVGTAFDEELHRAVRDQQVVEFEASSAVSGGSLEVRAYPSKNGLSVYSCDITERNRAREQLAYHASLLDNVEDGVIATDADDFRITAWNKGAERLYGFTAEAVLGRPAREVASYADDEARHKLEHELRETGRTVLDFTAQRRDGTPIEVELIAAKVKDGRGEVTGYLGIHRDVTERKRAEAELRQAHRQTESVLESINDFFSAFDRQWRYTYLNRRGLDRLRKATGKEVSRDDVVGKNFWELFPEFVGTPTDQELHRAVREQKTVVYETYSPVTESWVQVHAHPTADGGLSVYSHDITDRKEAEQRVVEAREAERSRLARALHDDALRGLSDAIALAAIADRTTAEPGLAAQLLPVLRRVGEELRSAIYELNSGSEEQRPFVELLARLVDEHRAMVGDCEIQLEIGDGVPAGSLGVKGVELLRILGEALTNARGHAEAERVHVLVWGSSDRLWIEVSDDGRGFDTATPVSPSHRGITGMRERAKLLNGLLEIHSEPGVGSRVRLEAPLANATS
jgi:PAS domain S-box-containing protein